MNVLEPVIFQCRVNGAQPAICVPGIRNTVVTYAELERMLDNITHVVMALELHPGQTVGILDFIRELRSERRFEQNMAP